MKAVTALLLCMSLFLLKGYIYAGVDHRTDTFSPTVNLFKKQAPQDLLPQAAVIKTIGTGEKNDIVMTVESESEDAGFTRKYILLAKYLVAFTFAFVLIQLYHSLISRLILSKQFCYTSDNKYIFQRVLRI
jgi:hypothetical protein